MRTLFFVLIVAFVLPVFAAEEAAKETLYNIITADKNVKLWGTFPVEKITDGDTIRVTIDGESTAIRCIGCNCPETRGKKKSACGLWATIIVTTLIESTGKKVTLYRDANSEKHSFNRELAWIVITGKNGTKTVLEEFLVDGGHASVGKEYAFSPAAKEYLSKLETTVKEKKQGIWDPKAEEKTQNMLQVLGKVANEKFAPKPAVPSAPAAAKTKQETTQPGNVWIAIDHGKKYHLRNCRTINKADTGPLKQLPLAEAKAAGYTACKVCGP
jgi:endonuclease YncB( thermonuclease family)